MAKIHDIRGKINGGTSKRSLSKINKIARHHSATNDGDYFSFWNGRWKGLGWKTGGYHELILRDGSVQLCYDADVITNGIKNHNSTTYHICIVGNGSFTPEQEATFEERCKLAMARFDISVNDILGHNEFSGASTACPGIDMDLVRDRLKGKSTTIEAPDTEVKSVIVTKPSNASKPTYSGNSYIKKFQTWLNENYNVGLVVDGKYGPKTKMAALKALQIELNRQFGAKLVVDGKLGPKTKAAIRLVSRGAEGNITRIIQGMLYSLGYDPKGYDGVFGNGTEIAVRAFQEDNNISVDGIVGKNTLFCMF